MPEVAGDYRAVIDRYPYTTRENIGYIRKYRREIDNMRGPDAHHPPVWLESRQQQISEFWRLYASFIELRETVYDTHGIEYWGGDIG